jgi:hypothetical protein
MIVFSGTSNLPIIIMNRLELSLVLVFTVVLLLPAATALQCVIGVSVQVGNSLIPIGGMVAPCSGECSNTTIYGTSMHMCDTDSIVNMYTFSRNLCVRSYFSLQSELQSCCYKLIYLLIYL